MKIARPVRQIYLECQELNNRLSEEVGEIVRPHCDANNWFYTKRVKELESYALKLETGRVPDPRQLEDFFACTIVVPTLLEVDQAEEFISLRFEVTDRRPPKNNRTHKRPSSFDFDDLRLYVRRKPPPSGSSEDLNDITFEVQIKTILQHAWSIATHDLIYKSDTVSWSKERIAFQVKAMLEHAEIAIAEAARLADTPAVAKLDKRTEAILSIINTAKQIWSQDRLPNDVKRLAENVYALLDCADISSDKLGAIIETEKQRIGLLPADLSPYHFCVQALANNSSADFERKFKRRHIRTRVVIHSGMEVPEWMRAGHERIVNLG